MEETYDYIVVGAGSAGCVLADRLSEDGAASVLVLEAGGRDSNPWIHVPIGYAKTLFDARVNWCFDMEPSPELGQRRLYMPCGRVLGGSSSINGLLYVRGQQQDYDDWARLGNRGWSWSDVLPFYRRSEDQQHGGDAFHGSGGPLPVSDQVERHALCEAFVESGRVAGYRATDDFNRGDQEGLGYYQVTARDGRRMSTAVAFLRRAERRPNVSLVTGAMVETIDLDGLVARGVTWRVGGVRRKAVARRCVVLAAGAINTPSLLQRSGIGRPDWLQAAGIDVKHALPGVGANLQDHLQAKLVYRCAHPVTLNDRARHLTGKVAMGLAYLLRRRGPLTIAAGQAGGFVRTALSSGRPDVQFHVMTFSSADLRKGLDEFSGMTISACQLRPESRGTVRVTAPDAAVAPAIAPEFLASETDRRTLVEGLRIGRRIAGAGPLSAELEREERPGVNVDSDEDLLAYVRATAGSVFHPAGTCRMGSDADAVVDERLRVRGVGRLMIADASIMPTIVSGNTNAACIMIGERAAAFLKEAA
ncbi:GMC family oxidoreductase [Paraburkholderia caballeronis]|uniref:Choline dehydrogenase n=1 Tax=Paraburkholderia caballeronis TaxID=416943 RepID=A0A1H7FW37_9BURK|nr:GMC family oxidoreductase N-terminal domain-containing protein [Paraburkholderia caballeronis]PXW24815.1 choline dehydrogenase [Paraburkholderia caballeronis]PXX00545.1 choline dehydrogenase [Paraburkholderia caballeronis]RAJ98608.1 choline dehydrogenase [Paraburkholderia caballeronis]TDV16570.1 choline dehydrogenase [Paraburkholderia caballeronis]TDV18966.1 choline dehydrogenase [Paraburkholderia caballeronis]